MPSLRPVTISVAGTISGRLANCVLSHNVNLRRVRYKLDASRGCVHVLCCTSTQLSSTIAVTMMLPLVNVIGRGSLRSTRKWSRFRDHHLRFGRLRRNLTPQVSMRYSVFSCRAIGLAQARNRCRNDTVVTSNATMQNYTFRRLWIHKLEGYSYIEVHVIRARTADISDAIPRSQMVNRALDERQPRRDIRGSRLYHRNEDDAG